MRLSIITVNLNNREGLQKTIDSVVSQTFKDFEWIVIDGGSTDGSKALIEQYADHMAYWVSEPDKGIYNAMNKGIKVSKGEYLYFLNSGDWLWEPDTLQSVFEAVDTLPKDCFVYGNYYDRDGSVYSPPEKLDLSLFLNSTLCHQAVFHPRLVFSEEGYDESFKIVADWKLLFDSIVFRCFPYQKLDAVFCSIQPGYSYDRSCITIEREKVVNVFFPPMVTEALMTWNRMEQHSMTPYYRKINAHPKLMRMTRRMVHFYEKLKCK